MDDVKDCRDCKHSFYEDLDSELCCRLQSNRIIFGVLDKDFDEEIPCAYDYSYPNICENFEDEVKK